MAKINYTQEQIQALNEVTDALNKIQEIDELIEKPAPFVVGKQEAGKRKGGSFIEVTDAKFEQVIIQKLQKIRRGYVLQIRHAQKHLHIVLSDEEMERLDYDASALTQIVDEPILPE